MKVYLAGGFKSGWQQRVKNKASEHVYFDPSTKEAKSKWGLSLYGTWDLHHIKQCNIVFAYMERTNPSGIGLAVEVGYAHGLGKTVILVLENNNKYHKDRYMQFLRKAADVVFDDLLLGIVFLQEF